MLICTSKNQEKNQEKRSHTFNISIPETLFLQRKKRKKDLISFEGACMDIGAPKIINLTRANEGI